MVDSSDHMRDHKCDHDDERYSEQPKNDWHLLPPMISTLNGSKTARFREYSRSLRGTNSHNSNEKERGAGGNQALHAQCRS
jgi:hypothetical protein